MGFINTLNIGGSDYALSDGGLYGTCSTGAGTAAKVVTCANFDELVEGTTIHVKFTYSNTASNATMNVNSTGAKNLCRYGTTRVGTTERSSWKAGAVVSFTYDGTSWVQNDYIEDTGVTTDTKNTAGAGNDAAVLYLIGAKSQGTNPQTYSNSHVWMENGGIVADSYNGIEISHPISDGFWLEFQYGTGTPKILRVPANKSYSLGDACAKGVDTSISAGSTSTKLPTTQAVVEYIAEQAAGASTFQGTLVQVDSGSSSTRWTQAELETELYESGWYWVVEEAGTYAGNVMEVGDMLFCVSDKANAYAAADFAAIQNNIETLTNPEIDTIWTNAPAVN